VSSPISNPLARAYDVIEDMTAVIAAKTEQELRISEKIAAAIGDMCITETTDMNLPELVDRLIDIAHAEHARAGTLAWVPEPEPSPPAVFLVFDDCGRIRVPSCTSVDDAMERAESMLREGSSGTVLYVARRVAQCAAHIQTVWTAEE
jgi:hypothetical protein